MYLFRLEVLRQRRNRHRADIVQSVLSKARSPLKNHVFSKQLQHKQNNLDEICSQNLE